MTHSCFLMVPLFPTKSKTLFFLINNESKNQCCAHKIKKLFEFVLKVLKTEENIKNKDLI